MFYIDDHTYKNNIISSNVPINSNQTNTKHYWLLNDKLALIWRLAALNKIQFSVDRTELYCL
jgi:hypothetical protein